ncbi:MAG: chorismate synthase [Nitrospirae bacterium]|nr:chorismate synthase [Nitrospirota bacterium]MBF0541767.1 chorismate synthase [Nitrospirota bacterium]
MANIRYITSGESHGQALTGIIEGLPSNLELSIEQIDNQLKRRQKGYGRGGRMKIESDKASVLSGLRWGKTIGSPLCLQIINKDWENWKQGMSIDSADIGSISPVTRARPGHADLSGALKYNQSDIRNILERSSARETAMRVALGAVARQFLSVFGVSIGSYIIRIGNAEIQSLDETLEELFKKAEQSEVRCPDLSATNRMKAAIDEAKEQGDTLGGTFVVFATGLPVGIGSHIQWDKKLDGRLAQAIMGIQAVKAVEFGIGSKAAELPGSQVMDEIFYDKDSGYYRKTNNAGGIEGGMTNGMPLIIRAVMKPIPTLRKPLNSVDIISKEAFKAAYERSDVCAVPACSVIAEAMTALVLADGFMEKFGGDSLEETVWNWKGYVEQVKVF